MTLDLRTRQDLTPAPLPAGAEERIAALSVSRIEALGEALLDFARPADLLDWLDRTVP